MGQNYSNIVAGTDSCYKKLYEELKDQYREVAAEAKEESAVIDEIKTAAETTITVNGEYILSSIENIKITVDVPESPVNLASITITNNDSANAQGIVQGYIYSDANGVIQVSDSAFSVAASGTDTLENVTTNQIIQFTNTLVEGSIEPAGNLALDSGNNYKLLGDVSVTIAAGGK